MENKTVVILDTETTGFIEPALIEAAGIVIKGNPQEEQKTTFINRYNPDKPISFGAMAIHNILDCDIKDCPPASDFKLPDNTGYIVGHNIDYDWHVIGKSDIKREVKRCSKN
ncbi:MAG: 3'-5' exonuclease [bacterium]